MVPCLQAIEYHLPARILTNSELAGEFPEWSVNKIEEKTGICERRISADGECASDLAACAAAQLFTSGVCRPEDIDYILLCTQSPDYFLPTTACLLQDRLGIPTSAGALDFNLGCSGFVYGLGIAKGLVESGQAQRVLLLTAETYTKFIHPRDKALRTIFGDGAAATLIGPGEPGVHSQSRIGPMIYGTDGSGGRNLIVEAGGLRRPGNGGPGNAQESACEDPEHLYMNGPEIFDFTVRVVPPLVTELLRRAGKRVEDIDLFVFHQANQYMLNHLRKKLRIPEERFFVHLRTCGNTVSSTIPIALKNAAADGRIKSGDLAMLVGFGVGYSWAAMLIEW
jgi:3-oxoacyl-[acyl-carrier-protein] synthase-3